MAATISFFGLLLLVNACLLSVYGMSISIFLEGDEHFEINGGTMQDHNTGQKNVGLFEGLSRLLEKRKQESAVNATKRERRAASWNVDSLVDEGWAVEWTTPNPNPEKKLNLHTILTISDEDVRKGQLMQVKKILVYSASIFGTTVVIIVFAVLFFRHPESFVCGCCFSYICIKACCPRLHVYMTNPEKYVHDRMNKFIPGMIVEEDGTILHYEPTIEELDLLTQIMEQLMEP